VKPPDWLSWFPQPLLLPFTIEARIAEEEAQLKLDAANEELAWIDETVIILDNEV